MIRRQSFELYFVFNLKYFKLYFNSMGNFNVLSLHLEHINLILRATILRQ